MSSTPRGPFLKSASSSFFIKPTKLFTEESAPLALHKAESSPQDSPRKLSKQSTYVYSPPKEKSNFIFINKKRVVDFMMTDSLIKHAKLTRENSMSHKVQVALLSHNSSNTNNTPLPNSRPVSTMSSPFAPKSPTNNIEMKTMGNDKAPAPGTAGANAKVMKFISPLNPRALFMQNEGQSGDKTASFIKHHNHRIYGRDHMNLKKLNAMLGGDSKKDTPKASKNQRAMRDSSSMQMQKLDLHKLVEMKADEENIAKNCTAYEYNPVLENYQFKEANLDDLENVVVSLTTPKDHGSCKVRSIILTDRSKHRSQILESNRNLPTHMNFPISINLETKYTEANQLPTVFASSGLLKVKRGSMKELGKITQGSQQQFFGINSERFGKLSAKKVAEETPEEQSQRIIAHTYRYFNEGSNSKISFRAGEDKMKKIEEICGKMETQNKKMLKKMNKNKRRLRKEYRSLDKRVGSVIDSKFKEMVVTATTQFL